MILTHGNEHYTVPDEVAKKIHKYDRIVEILAERSPYGGNRETCDMIRAIAGKSKESEKVEE